MPKGSETRALPGGNDPGLVISRGLPSGCPRVLRAGILTCVFCLVITGCMGRVRPIGEVQGRVLDNDDPLQHTSPFLGRTVRVRGIIHTRVVFGGPDNRQYALMIQNSKRYMDGDALTSDGILVLLGNEPELRKGRKQVEPQIGSEVMVEGTVTEHYGFTALSDVRLLEKLSDKKARRADIDFGPAEVTIPADPVEALRYWERHEGTLVRIPPGALCLSGQRYGEIFIAPLHVGVDLVRRAYSCRPFRPSHPLSSQSKNIPPATMISVGPLGLRGQSGNPEASLVPTRTFSRVTGAITGGVYFHYGKYVIQPSHQLAIDARADPARNAPPETFGSETRFTVATFNVENFYDLRDDPFDPCDYPGNAGNEHVSPPFNYIPTNQKDYDRQCRGIAMQIVQDLRSPDILMLQELEDQDICIGENGAVKMTDRNDADGKLDVLQDLGLAIRRAGGPEYLPACDRDGADARGIVCAFMYRPDRVSLVQATPDTPVYGENHGLSLGLAEHSCNRQTSNPKALNAYLEQGMPVYSRATQVALFSVSSSHRSKDATLIHCVNNHFKSNPGKYIERRRAQARISAVIARNVEFASPGVCVLVGGDLNVMPRPDEPLAPDHPLFPSDQLAPLYDAGLHNLHDVMITQAPASAYTYVYRGVAQTLDQIFVNSPLSKRLHSVHALHINADWSPFYPGSTPRGVSDHDPVLAVFSF